MRDVGAAFAALPFDHLLFTGSTAVGRKVMAAAAPNLTPVTLELGGKSPAIVCADFPLDTAAARISTGKWFNAGQTCIGVDYVLVDAARRDALVAGADAAAAGALRRPVATPTTTPASSTTRSTRGCRAMSTTRAHADCRCCNRSPIDPQRARSERLFPPTLVLEPRRRRTADARGDLRPDPAGEGYRILDEAIAYVNTHARPLALYPFSRDGENIERILARTRSGGVTVNDTLLHFGVHALPFGGIGPSGMGAIHGRAGFDTFSKQLPVFRQARMPASDWIKPPYRGVVDRMIRFLAK